MLRENTEKYFSVPINKELNNDKTITYEIRLIDSFRCQAHYLILLIILLKDFITRNAKIVSLVLNT